MWIYRHSYDANWSLICSVEASQLCILTLLVSLKPNKKVSRIDPFYHFKEEKVLPNCNHVIDFLKITYLLQLNTHFFFSLPGVISNFLRKNLTNNSSFFSLSLLFSRNNWFSLEGSWAISLRKFSTTQSIEVRALRNDYYLYFNIRLCRRDNDRYRLHLNWWINIILFNWNKGYDLHEISFVSVMATRF